MRPKKPPRLYLRPGIGRRPLWVIRHGSTMIGTGFSESEQSKADEVLAAYCDALGGIEPDGATFPQLSRQLGFVYFLTADYPGFPIKIGWAANTALRRQALQCGLPYRASMLASFVGTKDDEHRLHVGFNQDRLEGEWFKRSHDLMALIERTRLSEIRASARTPVPFKRKGK